MRFLLFVIILFGATTLSNSQTSESVKEMLLEYDNQADGNEVKSTIINREKIYFQSKVEEKNRAYVLPGESEFSPRDLDKVAKNRRKSNNLKLVKNTLIVIFAIGLLWYCITYFQKKKEIGVSGDKRIKTNGYYQANKRGFSENANSEYNLYYVLNFNLNGLVSFVESNDEPVNISFEELVEFDDLKEYDEFCDISRYSLKGNELTVKLYKPDDNIAYETGTINEKNYVEWVGKIVDEDSMILSFRYSYYNYALMDYTIDYFFNDLEFRFIGVTP